MVSGKTRIVTFSGASGVGKTTLVSKLLRELVGSRMVESVTTRSPRSTDILGEYRYVDKKEFLHLDDLGTFIWAKSFGGHCYGTERHALANALVRGYFSFMILTPDTVPKLHQYAPEQVVSFYLLSPPDKELTRRLLQRGDSSYTAAQRLANCADWDETAKFDSHFQFIQSGSKRSVYQSVLSQLRCTQPIVLLP